MRCPNIDCTMSLLFSPLPPGIYTSSQNKNKYAGDSNVFGFPRDKAIANQRAVLRKTQKDASILSITISQGASRSSEIFFDQLSLILRTFVTKNHASKGWKVELVLYCQCEQLSETENSMKRANQITKQLG
jgi:hypothetical protein